MRLAILIMLSVILTGCATGKERGTYNENDEPVEIIEDTVENIEETATEETATDETAKNDLLYINRFINDDNGDIIVVSVDESKKITLIFTPSEADSNNVYLYENRCSSAILLMYGLVKNDSYTLSVSDDIHYCDCLITKDSDGMTIFSSDRDGTSHISTFDGTVGDWLNEAINNPSSVTKNNANLWIADTCETISKEIEGIYP